jgi:hypothetical protein
MVENQPRAFVFTITKIKAGDILYIDYDDEYNNDGFIHPK